MQVFCNLPNYTIITVFSNPRKKEIPLMNITGTGTLDFEMMFKKKKKKEKKIAIFFTRYQSHFSIMCVDYCTDLLEISTLPHMYFTNVAVMFLVLISFFEVQMPTFAVLHPFPDGYIWHPEENNFSRCQSG